MLKTLKKSIESISFFVFSEDVSEKIVFKKPTKRKEVSELSISSSKRKKDLEEKHQKSTMKQVKDKKLLSFDVEEEDD